VATDKRTLVAVVVAVVGLAAAARLASEGGKPAGLVPVAVARQRATTRRSPRRARCDLVPIHPIWRWLIHPIYRWLNPPVFFLGHGHGHRMLAEMGDRVAEVIQEQRGHIPAYSEADQDALDGDVGGGSGEGVGGHLPPANTQPVGQVEQRVAGIGVFADPPGDGGDAGRRVAVAQQLERASLTISAARYWPTS